jgi:Ca2+-transporting ATPase
VIASLICLCIVFIYGLTRNEWLDAVLIGMTLAMAILPNELPAVLLIFLAGGAWRISKRQVLTRKIPAIEALGSASVLCVDKTGTITQNRMTVEALWVKGKVLKLHEWGGRRLPEEYHEVLEFGVLASRIDPFDPMEQAIQNAGRLGLFESEHLHPSWGVIKEYPLTENLFAVSYVWRANQNDDDFVVGGKGAPEAIIDLCHLPELDALRVREQALEMAQAGLRVLGVAKGKVFHSLPVIQHDLDFEFLGLLGLEDPIRPEVPAFVNECKTAGIRIIMITGDHPETARSIARQIGLPASDQVLTGYDIESLDDSSFLERLKFTNIFSRMLPGQKLKIVKALKKTGEVVAMTGDGINDVPALNAADIGVAMGRRGTDVAREAASVVLMNDDFPSIIAAISLNAPIIPV